MNVLGVCHYGRVSCLLLGRFILTPILSKYFKLLHISFAPLFLEYCTWCRLPKCSPITFYPLLLPLNIQSLTLQSPCRWGKGLGSSAWYCRYAFFFPGLNYVLSHRETSDIQIFTLIIWPTGYVEGHSSTEDGPESLGILAPLSRPWQFIYETSAWMCTADILLNIAPPAVPTLIAQKPWIWDIDSITKGDLFSGTGISPLSSCDPILDIVCIHVTTPLGMRRTPPLMSYWAQILPNVYPPGSVFSPLQCTPLVTLVYCSSGGTKYHRMETMDMGYWHHSRRATSIDVWFLPHTSWFLYAWVSLYPTSMLSLF